MNYRGKLIRLARYEGCEIAEYICTAHFGGHVEVVCIEAGLEHVVYPPIPIKGDHSSGLLGTVFSSRDDLERIELVKNRCRTRLNTVLRLAPTDAAERANWLVGERLTRYKGLHTNLDRLQSLDGDQPAATEPPTPDGCRHSALDQVFGELYGGDAGVIHDSIFVTMKPRTLEKPMIGEHPDYTGKLVFIEIPLECDDCGESGEYIIVKQSPDSLYGVQTACCVAGLEVTRIPFAHNGRAIAVLDAYEDDNFVQEFIERLDDMDTDDYSPIECDWAETASRQLARMLEQKLMARAQALCDSFARIAASAGKWFNAPLHQLGSYQAEDRRHRASCYTGV